MYLTFIALFAASTEAVPIVGSFAEDMVCKDFDTMYVTDTSVYQQEGCTVTADSDDIQMRSFQTIR